MVNDKIIDYKTIKCKCCKKFGHKIEDCNRDPNLKTREDALKDSERVDCIKDSK